MCHFHPISPATVHSGSQQMSFAQASPLRSSMLVENSPLCPGTSTLFISRDAAWGAAL